jgi:hypothetical protein
MRIGAIPSFSNCERPVAERDAQSSVFGEVGFEPTFFSGVVAELRSLTSWPDFVAELRGLTLWPDFVA